MTTQQDVAATIIALERAAMDRWIKCDPDGFLEIYAPDVTYFDPFIERPIRGLEALSEYYHQGSGGGPVDSDEMIDPKVQVSGGVAVLTYNYVSRYGQRVRRWNATEVYRRDADGWRIIHAHWSFLKPQLATS